MTDGELEVTSLYDWETGNIVPALLSDPEMAVAVDLMVDEDGAPSISRVESEIKAEDREHYMACSGQYFQVCQLFSKTSYMPTPTSLANQCVGAIC